MIINVTQKNIDRGEHDPFLNPISLAFYEAGFMSALIWSGVDVSVNDFIKKIPAIASRWKRKYDKGKKVEPFSFEFDWEHHMPENEYKDCGLIKRKLKSLKEEYKSIREQGRYNWSIHGLIEDYEKVLEKTS